MRILVFGINYSPDLTGIGKYTGEMCSFLASQGHQVTMVTAHPYYPQWELAAGYPKYFWKTELIDGVTVERCPLYIPQDPNALRKILHEVSFLGTILPVWFKLLFKKKYDYVLCINPPFHLTVYPLLYKWIRNSKLISHVQDLQVDVVNDLELIRSKAMIKLMFAFEKFLLKQSDYISTISLGMERKIASKGISKDKQWLFPNWVDSGFITPLSKKESLRSQFGLNYTDKVILYSGNLGEKQGLEYILDVALRFKGQSDIQFVIVGNGGAKNRLEEAATEMGLDNLRFFPLQPYGDLSRLLAVADVHLVLQKKEASDLVMPSKLTGILAAGGLALITAVEGTSLYDVVHKYKMGVLIEPGSVDALYDGIVACLATVDAGRIKMNAREYALAFLAKETVLGSFEQKLLLNIG
ncbi:colanic acid biosynthesis glycosyl transferase WcaI [Algoriphagus sp. 4150]|uniref:WcaI family glycosyltransferase n=1 Tax=Algoriphagus sp. 4150 TaxID=2817756 RepID=UPI00285D261D|nr:WcaI family glycosyltransferase [Algoriphagus sp. 4150]MDR7127780.1 colanic acid biosynthesis glycosyl transferase WcaI [Algoriphagus sp. 4150]